MSGLVSTRFSYPHVLGYRLFMHRLALCCTVGKSEVYLAQPPSNPDTAPAWQASAVALTVPSLIAFQVISEQPCCMRVSLASTGSG